jgi:[glutamine synthetase] adenylyltransferase / [glutamine synthetase]-adenylyl-L-tyrosine phosphorylase
MTVPVSLSSAAFARLGFSDSRTAAADWRRIDCPDDDLLNALAGAADPDQAIADLARMLAQGGPEAAALRTALPGSPGLQRRLAYVLGASTALGDYLVRHVAEWRQLAEPDQPASPAWGVGHDRRRHDPGRNGPGRSGPGRMDPADSRPRAEAITAELAQAADPNQLRVIYRRLLLRLVARDLTLQPPSDVVSAELADLAAGAMESALAIARADLGDAAEGVALSIIGMGKCGAQELNYVSDVDVVFVAESAGELDESVALRRATALASATMRICSEHTAEGTLWPVDAALRPEGKAGPLVRTVASHRAYYDRWAKTWEFQALLKARPIAGDVDLGRRYMAAIAPLVWAASARPDFVPDVQAMRRRVVESLPADRVDRQVKLGPGGLRDVEFAVQLLQLVHGRSDPSLRMGNTIGALEALTNGGYVGREDGAALAEAYRFLRSLEHRLQLAHLRRTHLVPTDRAALRALGRSLGFMSDPIPELTKAWERHAREVRRLHEKLFYRPLLSAVARLPGSTARLSPDAARERLEALGYTDARSALRHIEALTSGVSRRAAIQRTLLPVMLGWFAEAPNADVGLLEFRRMSDELGTTPWYLRMLRDEGVTAERLAHLLATSRYASSLLARDPQSTALLADDTQLVPRDLASLTAQLTSAATRNEDPAAGATAVRAGRRRELFRIAAADLLGLTDVVAVGSALSDVAGASLAGGLAVAEAAVRAERRGDLPTRIAIIAVGRLGGHEMAYGSDADVLFVHDPVPGADEQAATDAAFAVANELRRLFAQPGPDPAMPIDADLRPEGRQGPLVRTLASYAAYYTRWSRPWEAQALLRARPIAGDPGVGERFVTMVDPLRYPSAGISADDIVEIRRTKARVDSERLPRGADPATHLKLGRGGLSDVEWTAQLLQMRHAGTHPSLRDTRTVATLREAARLGLIQEADVEILVAAWLLASRVRNATMLARGRQSDALPAAPDERAAVAYICGYAVGQSERLLDDYLRAARRASRVVQETFWS